MKAERDAIQNSRAESYFGGVGGSIIFFLAADQFSKLRPETGH